MGTHGLAERGPQRVDLHVALHTQRWGQLLHEGPVLVEPVALELLTREMWQAAEAEDELDHDGLGKTFRRKQCACPTGQSSARAYIS